LDFLLTINCHNDLGEGPLWDPRENALYWLDINQAKIQRRDTNGTVQVFDMPFKVTALGLRKAGGFIAASERGFHYWDGQGTALEFIAHPEQGKAGARFNDGKVDRAGRFWAGTMDPRSATSALYRLNTNLQVNRMETDITISNGIGWSPDNKVMYYVDTLHYVVYTYDFDLAKGKLSNRRVFLQTKPDEGVPDGLTVDSRGYIWIAFYDGWRVTRYTPEGKVDKQVDLPVARPTCPAFSGPELDELYITTAIDGLPADELAQQPQAGNLFMVKPGVSGLPEPEFAG
jgi:sugar lactone lactonase YvrE